MAATREGLEIVVKNLGSYGRSVLNEMVAEDRKLIFDDFFRLIILLRKKLDCLVLLCDECNVPRRNQIPPVRPEILKKKSMRGALRSPGTTKQKPICIALCKMNFCH